MMPPSFKDLRTFKLRSGLLPALIAGGLLFSAPALANKVYVSNEKGNTVTVDQYVE